MIFEHEFIDLANTAGISNVSTRGQPITSTLCKNGDISDKLIRYVHRIAYSNFSNKEIINGTINWSSTSEGSDYWFGLYINTKK